MSAIQQLLISYATGGTPPPAEVTRELTDSFSFAATGTYTEVGASFGAAETDRLIFVCVSAANVTDGTSITAVTIGGVGATSASAVVRTSGLGFGILSQIWWAAVPSGTSGDVVLTFTGKEVAGSAAVYKVRGANTSAPIASQNTGSVATGNVTAALTISNETACLATAQCGISGTDVNITWTNITEDADLAVDLGGSNFVNNGFASRADTVGPGATTFTASPAAATIDDDKTMAAVEIDPAP
jgi:hypothetical protein